MKKLWGERGRHGRPWKQFPCRPRIFKLPATKPVAIFRALANETRLEIIRLLGNTAAPGLRSGEIAIELKFQPPVVSHHLLILRRMEIITHRKLPAGKYYTLNTEEHKNFALFNLIL
jgi:DNA-binding transcriptional ArsR family regulator